MLPPVASPEAALAPGAPRIHANGNVLSQLVLHRGDAEAALASATHVVEERFTTPFTDHAFMEPESALGYPPDSDGVVLVRTGEQNVYDGQRYVADTLGIPRERVRVVSEYVGGGFGGKEDQTVQHVAALLAWLSGQARQMHPGKGGEHARAREAPSHDHRPAPGLRRQRQAPGACAARIVADTGAYASLGGPCPAPRRDPSPAVPTPMRTSTWRALQSIRTTRRRERFEALACPRSTLPLKARSTRSRRAGLSPWEIRFRNAVSPGERLPNGQIAGPDTALEECLLAVKESFEESRASAGIACGFKNTGLGMGHPDVGRCRSACPLGPRGGPFRRRLHWPGNCHRPCADRLPGACAGPCARARERARHRLHS